MVIKQKHQHTVHWPYNGAQNCCVAFGRLRNTFMFGHYFLRIITPTVLHESSINQHTVSYYNAIQHSKISHTALNPPKHNINQILNSQILYSWGSYGVSIVSALQQIDLLITALHGTYFAIPWSDNKLHIVKSGVSHACRLHQYYLSMASQCREWVYSGVEVKINWYYGTRLSIQLHNFLLFVIALVWKLTSI